MQRSSSAVSFEEEVDEKTADILKKAGLTRMPRTAIEWAKFERVENGEVRTRARACARCFPTNSLRSFCRHCSDATLGERWRNYTAERCQGPRRRGLWTREISFRFYMTFVSSNFLAKRAQPEYFFVHKCKVKMNMTKGYIYIYTSGTPRNSISSTEHDLIIQARQIFRVFCTKREIYDPSCVAPHRLPL